MSYLFKKKIQVLFGVLLLAGCAAVTANLPSITDEPTGNRHNGRIVWHDLLTTAPVESRKFYGDLFGWEFENPGIDLGFGGPESYMLIRHEGRLIGGMFDANNINRDVNVSQWVTVMSVDDIDAAAGRVIAEGGEVLTEPTDVGLRGMLAVVAGSDGALFAMVQTRDGDPVEQDPQYDEWLWNELWTDNVDGATDFYRAVAGFDVDDRAVGETDDTYRLLTAGEDPRAGILPMPFEGERPVWVDYLRVEETAAVTAGVEGLGGRVSLDARPRQIGGKVAFIAGPSGAGIALQTWPLD